MAFDVCIDIGGTFTDCVITEDRGEMRIFKSPTTPGQFARGVMDVLGLAAAHYGQEPRAFLANVDSIVHGTTVSTNALVEGRTARVGLICNEGHPDVLTLREAQPKRTFDWRLDYPDPFVPRHLTVEVAGRIDADGQEYAPLSEADVRAAIAHFRTMEVEAVAVCLLWSIVNSAHEDRIGEIFRQEWPEMPVTLSHRLNPIPREYRRTISAAIDASLHPIVGAYVGELRDSLAEAGFRKELLLANCIGGMMPPDEMLRKPIYSVMSGPTLAPIAASHLTEEEDVIVIDMGGTTFDVSAIRAGRLVVSPEAMFGNDRLGIPKVDVRSIGAGGGSIAWVDVGGLLHVGPQSAGAVPGPACYGKGGTEPTVTDANVILGIIDPDYYLGGRIRLDRAAAERAVGTVADALGIDLVEAAYTIHTTSNHHMIAAIEDITVNEGINPRESYLVAGGGATACHVGEMVRELGITNFMIPKLTAGLSALGGLISEIKWEETATLHTDAARFAGGAVNGLLERLRESGNAFLARAGVPAERRRFEYAFMGRYQYQSWEIEVPFTVGDAGLGESNLETLVEGFHRTHERVYTIRIDEDLVEFTTWKVRAVGERWEGDAVVRGTVPAQDGPLPQKAPRQIYVRELGGLTEVPVYDGGSLGSAAVIEGPAVIEEETTTVLLLPGMTATTDARGNYRVNF
ncbi:MAG: hydantoinase/oxoprolinase family protein [Rhodospirillales bacterium]|nr:hydantoinase/oxoprolinase family protein [Rhodospirillales bacterium]